MFMTIDFTRTSRSRATTRSDEDGVVVFRNAQECSFRNNELYSYAGTTIRNAANFHTPVAARVTVKGWDIAGNRIRGDARTDGSGTFTHGLIFKPVAVGVEDIRVSDNTFKGCATQIFFAKGASDAGSYGNVPIVIGNNGDGIPYDIQIVDDAPVIAAILIGGNDGALATTGTFSGSAAVYCGSGEPSISAGKGSIYMRTDEGAGRLLFVNIDGASSWQPFA